MSTGPIKKVVSEHGFGFIEAADGKEHFFYRSGVDASVNFDSLMGGENVISTSSRARGARALTASAWRS